MMTAVWVVGSATRYCQVEVWGSKTGWIVGSGPGAGSGGAVAEYPRVFGFTVVAVVGGRAVFRLQYNGECRRVRAGVLRAR